ncbi:MAG: hypothetical protein E7021_02480 [Alphaproteobacteria bacterium]|nr:hypothetical protein [Alphaproteobacteria bacterium]
MSRSKSELSTTERMLLTFIKFKTNNNHQFYMGNDAIALGIGIQPTTVKSIVNRLVREGYLIKTTDNKKKRYLSLSGKEFIPITGNMADVDKKIAKQGQENAQRWADYYEMENKGLKKENEQLTAENLNLSKVLRGLRKETYGKVIPLLIQSEIRIACLEQLFLNNGCSKEKLEQLIRENNYYDFSIVDFLKSDLQEHLTQEELEDLVKPTSYAYKIQTIIKSPKSSGVV